MPPTNHPLSDDTLNQLDNFLLEQEEECLPIDEAHGYLTALLVCDAPTSEEDMFEAIWGTPKFESKTQQNELEGLLRTLHQNIAATLQSGLKFEPMIIEEEIDGEIYEAHEGWCYGFMLGLTQHSELWDNISKQEQELLTPIAQLSLLHTSEDDDMDDEEYAICADLIPGSVTGLYAYFHQ